MPKFAAFSIDIRPHETLTVYSSDWLDLEDAKVDADKECDDGIELMFIAMTLAIMVVVAALLWCLMVGRRAKKV